MGYNIVLSRSHLLFMTVRVPLCVPRAPSEEWKAKIEAAQSEFEKERSQRIDKEKDLTRYLIQDSRTYEN